MNVERKMTRPDSPEMRKYSLRSLEEKIPERRRRFVGSCDAPVASCPGDESSPLPACVSPGIARQNGFADAHKFVRVVRREREAFKQAVFSRDQNVAAQIRIIELDAPGKSFPPAENGRTNFDVQNLVRGNGDGVEENPRLQLQPVGINPVLLPQTGRRAARHENRWFTGAHN